MTTRDELLQAIEGLSESDLATLLAVARRFRVTLAPAGEGVDLAAIMDAAPEDDEPVTADDLAAIAEGAADIAAGRVHTSDEIRTMLGI